MTHLKILPYPSSGAAGKKHVLWGQYAVLQRVMSKKGVSSKLFIIFFLHIYQ